ncbi:MAG: hypothetical protein U0V73_13425 [Acidimicrobiia bacterium]
MRQGGRGSLFARSVAVLCALTACSGAGHPRVAGRQRTPRPADAQARSTSPRARPESVRAPEDTISTTTVASSRGEPTPTTIAPAHGNLVGPIPRGSLRGTPRPELHNTGTDYAAVFASLIYQFRWLTENPDGSLVSEIIAPGSRVDAGLGESIRWMEAHDQRSADAGYRLVSATVGGVTPDLVVLHTTEWFDFEDYVDATGRVVEHIPDERSFVRNWGITGDPVRGWKLAFYDDAGPIRIVEQ